MTEKALFPSDDRTYGMERTSDLPEIRFHYLTAGV